jgi:cobalt-zinc-cadmium efflux system outer membrane protein
MNGLRSVLAVIGVLTGSVATAAAQNVTFDEAIGLAEVGPDVRAATRTLEVRRGRDGAISDITGWTQIWLQPGWRALEQSDQAYESQYYATHSWSLSDLANLQRSAASSERDVLDAEARRAALARRIAAAQAWIALRTSERLLELAAELSAAVTDEIAVMEHAVSVGVRTRTDLGETQVWSGELALLALALEERAADARIALALAMATDRRAPGLNTAGPLPEPVLPAPGELTRMLEDVDALPEVELRALGAIEARAHAEEAHAFWAPQLQLGVQLQNEAPSGLSVFGIAALTFGLADLGARGYAQMLGEAELADATVDVVRAEARAEIERVLHAVEHERERVQLVTTRLVPALEALIAAREASLTAGEGTMFELILARRRLGDARVEQIDAEGARAEAEVHAWLVLAELERARRSAP